MKIKVCGMRDAENIREVSKLNIDMMGFVFIPSSPHFIKMISSSTGILPDYSMERYAENNEKEVGQPQKQIDRVGVFADDMPQNIITRVYNYKLDYVQLNGDESAVMIENLLNTLRPSIQPNIKIIKKIMISNENSFAVCSDFEPFVDYFVFDCSPCHNDFSVLQHYHCAKPFLIGGAIGLPDVESLKAIHHSMMDGVSVNSAFEMPDGTIDVSKLQQFIHAICL